MPGPVTPGYPQFPSPGAALPIYRGARNFPWLRAYGFVHDAWDIWQWYRQIQKSPNPGGWEDFPGTNFSCGSITGDVNNVVMQGGNLAGSTSPTLCALTFQATPVPSTPTRTSGWKLFYLRTYPVGASTRSDYRAVRSFRSSVPPRQPQFIVGNDLFVPLLPDPAGFGIAPGGGLKYSPQVTEEPQVSPAPGHLRSRPPGKGVHERKGQVASAVGKAVAVAFAGTEAADAIDAIWKALPKDIRKQTRKSGTARKGAFIGEGTKYSTPIDKAFQIFKHYMSLNLSEAARNLLINHFVDKIIGNMSRKGADALRKRLGASGWGNVI